jgi:hypothetical protein
MGCFPLADHEFAPAKVMLQQLTLRCDIPVSIGMWKILRDRTVSQAPCAQTGAPRCYSMLHAEH